jgi:hypothetical protein
MNQLEFFDRPCDILLLHNTSSLRGAACSESGIDLFWDDYTPKQSSCSEFAAKLVHEDCFVTSFDCVPASLRQNSVNTNLLFTYSKNAPRNDLYLPSNVYDSQKDYLCQKTMM